MKASEVRKAFKDLGYTIKLKKHSLIDNAKKLYLYFGEICVVGDFNVYPQELYQKHKEAIEKVNALRGTILDSGEKVI